MNENEFTVTFVAVDAIDDGCTGCDLQGARECPESINCRPKNGTPKILKIKETK